MLPMKRLILLAFLLPAVSNSMSMDFGVGIELERSPKTVYVPIAVTEDVRIEPYFAFGKTSNTSSQSGSSSYSIYGVGLFALKPMAENARIFGGFRLARQTQKQASSGNYSYSSSGYLIEPTIGFECLVTKAIAVGAEAAISYSRTTGSQTGTFINGDGSTRDTGHGTTTAVTLKYYFN
jgi:hypothetical protein